MLSDSTHGRSPEESHPQRQEVDGGGQGLGEGLGSQCFMGTVSIWEDEKVLETDGGDGSTTTCMYLMPLNCALKNAEFNAICISTHTHTHEDVPNVHKSLRLSWVCVCAATQPMRKQGNPGGLTTQVTVTRWHIHHPPAPGGG